MRQPHFAFPPTGAPISPRPRHTYCFLFLATALLVAGCEAVQSTLCAAYDLRVNPPGFPQPVSPLCSSRHFQVWAAATQAEIGVPVQKPCSAERRFPSADCQQPTPRQMLSRAPGLRSHLPGHLGLDVVVPGCLQQWGGETPGPSPRASFQPPSETSLKMNLSLCV